jgi:hypothetical protein
MYKIYKALGDGFIIKHKRREAMWRFIDGYIHYFYLDLDSGRWIRRDCTISFSSKSDCQDWEVYAEYTTLELKQEEIQNKKVLNFNDLLFCVKNDIPFRVRVERKDYERMVSLRI